MKLSFNTYKLSFIFFLLTTGLFAQNEIENLCETVTTTENMDHLKSLKLEMEKHALDFNNKHYAKSTKSAKLINKIPLKIHIIRNSDGSNGLDKYDLEIAIDNLNRIYSNAYMEFYVFEEINYIDDTNRSSHFVKGDEKTLSGSNYVPGIINIYFTDYIENASEQSICGYGINDKKVNLILMKNSCAMNGSSLAHEMGHIFSLVHTHGPWNSKLTTELVDGSNCDTDGDGICDTPADPRLSSQNVNSNCEYIGNQTDSNGDVFNPDTGNIMSYSRKACRGYFTPQQLSRMYAFFQVEKNDFIQTEKGIELNEDYSASNDLNIVSIYPNPVRNSKIYLKDAQGFNEIGFQIMTLQGQIIAKGKTTNSEVNVEQLSSGSYLIIMEHNNSKTVKRFIK